MRRIPLVFSIGIIVTGCVEKGPVTTNTLTKEAGRVVPSGFVCSATPSETYGPGYVYRLDRAGAELLVTDLGSSAKTFSYSGVFPTYEGTISQKADPRVSLLKKSAAGNGDLSVGETANSKVSFTNGRYVRMNAAGVESLLSELDSQVTPKDGSRYFVVRDTIQASGISIQLSGSDENKLGGEAKISSFFSATPSVTITRQGSLGLVSTFDKPLNVCILAVELQPPAAGTGGEFVPVSEGSAWRVTNRAASQGEMDILLAN